MPTWKIGTKSTGTYLPTVGRKKKNEEPSPLNPQPIKTPDIFNYKKLMSGSTTPFGQPTFQVTTPVATKKPQPKLSQGREYFEFPKNLGGGAYFKDYQGTAPRGDYGGIQTKEGYERDHIVSLFLDAPDIPENIKLRQSGNLIERFLDTPVQQIPQKRRQEGKLKKEMEIYYEFQKSDKTPSDRNKAILDMKRWEFEKELKANVVDTVKGMSNEFGKLTKDFGNVLTFGVLEDFFKGNKSYEEIEKELPPSPSIISTDEEVDITKKPNNKELLSLGLGPVNWDNLTDDGKKIIKQHLDASKSEGTIIRARTAEDEKNIPYETKTEVKEIADAFYLGARNILHSSKQYFLSSLPNKVLSKKTEKDLMLTPGFPVTGTQKEKDAFIEKRNSKNEKLRESFKNAYVKSEKKYQKFIQQNPQLQPSRDAWDKPVMEVIKENPYELKNPAYWGYVASKNASFMLGVMGTTLTATAITKNPAIGLMSGLAVATPMTSQGLYEDLISEGATDVQAAKLAVPIGMVIAGVEVLGDLPILSSFSKPFADMFRRNVTKEVSKLTVGYIVSKSLKKFGAIEIAEIAEEVVQLAIQNAVVKTFNEERGILDGVINTVLETGISVAPFALIGAGADVRVDVAKQLDNFSKTPLGQALTEQRGSIKNPFVKEEEKPSFKEKPKEEPQVTTRVLEELKGKDSVSKQFISDLTNRPDLKQAERDIIRETLDEMPEGKINVQEFTEKVQVKLLPLSIASGKTNKYAEDDNAPGGFREAGDLRYEHISLPDEQRGNVASYDEVIYESPIKNSAGSVHFGEDFTNYFAHVRIEDMAIEDRKPKRLSNGKYEVAGASGTKVFDTADEALEYQTGKRNVGATRRIIEVQSDLFQKGRLEIEFGNFEGGTKEALREATSRGLSTEEIKEMFEVDLDEIKIKNKEIYNQLQVYRNTWYERIIREEIKRAAQDNKTTLLFPTGETAMKVEGLGTGEDDTRWSYEDEGYPVELSTNDLKVGLEVTESSENYTGDAWIITEVLENGKFKAVPKDKVSSEPTEEGGSMLDDGSGRFFVEELSEEFDTSGKIDTSNPIYKFYEKDVSKYLKRIHPEMKLVTDPQGVTWFEIKPKLEEAKAPVYAFKEKIKKGEDTREGIPVLEEEAITGEQAIANAQKVINRLKLSNVDAQVVDKILTGDDGEAFASSFGKDITFINAVPQFSGEHEIGHTIFRNLENLDLFSKRGITRENLMAELKSKYPEMNNTELQEQLMQDLELYLDMKLKSKPTTVTGKIKQFFENIWNMLKRVFSQENISTIRKFYETIETGKAKTPTAVKEVKAKPAFKEKPTVQEKTIGGETKGIVTLYHVTSPENAIELNKTGIPNNYPFYAWKSLAEAKEWASLEKKSTEIVEIRGIPLNKKGAEKPIGYTQILSKNDIVPKSNILGMIEAGIKKGIAKKVPVAKEAMRAKIRAVRASKVAEAQKGKAVRKAELKGLKQTIIQGIKRFEQGSRSGQRYTKAEIKQVQTDLIKIMEESPSIPKNFLRKIKNTNDIAKLFKMIPVVLDQITSLEEKAEIRKLKIAIKKELKSTKPKKVAGKPLGKFTAEVQEVLNIMRDASKLTADEAAAKIFDNLETNKEGYSSQMKVYENRILAMMANWKTISVKDLQEILDEINEMKETGQMMKALRDFNYAEEVNRKADFIVDTVTGGKGLTSGRQTTGLIKKKGFDKLKADLKTFGKGWVMSWNGVNSIYEWNLPVDEKGSIIKSLSVKEAEDTFKNLQTDYINEFSEAISEAYGIENNPLKIGKKINELKKDIVIGTFKNSIGQDVEIVMNKDQIIKRWMEFQDTTLDEAFEEGNNYTQEIKDAIVSLLTSADKVFAEKQFEIYENWYQKQNPVFRLINGVNLPHNPNYSPIRREGFKLEEDIGFNETLNEINFRRTINPSSQKSRVRNNNPIALQGSMEVLDRNITETSYYVAWVQKARELDAIFKKNKVRESIKQEFNAEILAVTEEHIESFITNGKNHADRSGLSNWLTKGRKTFTLGALMIKPALTVKQMISTLAYAEKLSAKDLTIGVADFFKNPIENYKILASESVLIRERGKNIERDIADAMKTDVYKRFSKYHTFANTLMLNVILGDKGAIVVGSWAMRKKALSQGLSKEATVQQYEEFSSETQQSSDLSQLSAVQKGGALWKLFTMFQSSQRQYFAKEVNAIKTLFQKGGRTPKNIRKVARTMFIYHVLLPVFFQMVVNFFRFDDEAKKEYLRAGILGSLNGFFIVNDILEGIISAAMGMKVWEPNIPILGMTKDITDAISKVDWTDIEIDELLEALNDFVDAGNVLGIPTKQVKGLYTGAKELIDGDIKNGIAQMLGWSKYSLGMTGKKKKGAFDLDFNLDLDLDLDLDLGL